MFVVIMITLIIAVIPLLFISSFSIVRYDSDDEMAPEEKDDLRKAVPSYDMVCSIVNGLENVSKTMDILHGRIKVYQTIIDMVGASSRMSKLSDECCRSLMKIRKIVKKSNRWWEKQLSKNGGNRTQTLHAVLDKHLVPLHKLHDIITFLQESEADLYSHGVIPASFYEEIGLEPPA